MTEWFIAGDPEKFRIVEAFRELRKVDWRQCTSIATGDTVYIYISKSEQAVRLKCRATKVDISDPDIDDSEFNITDEFSEKDRCMELELIDELKGQVYGRQALERHGFRSPQSPVRVKPQIKEYLDLIQKLQHAEDMDPDLHDGTYELLRLIISLYKEMDDLSECDYRDLNLVYLSTVGTWKQGIEAKKSTIRDSHLPEEKKQVLFDALDRIWGKAQNGEYSNNRSAEARLGMFGTGFFTFKGKTDDVSPVNFIKMCIDIMNMQDEDEILNRCEKTLTGAFRGMKAASASMVLHCLKPTIFPIFNSNMGSGNIFSYFGVDLKAKNEIGNYIANTRLVREFRNENFSIKNYRIFDLAAKSISINEEDDETEKGISWWPSEDEYSVDLTKDDWKRFLEVELPNHKSGMRVLKCFLDIGGVASPKMLSEKYKGHPTVYTSNVYHTCSRAISYFGKNPCPDNGANRYFPIGFRGHYGVGDSKENKTYVYKMRPELFAALQEIDMNDINLGYKGEKEYTDIQYDHNMILYGPPGTGKTYNTAIYAVSICDGVPLNETKERSYSDVMDRFKELKDTERIAFTTFHQSYGYEEFIEGIRPDVSNGDKITYVKADGVFKKFCKTAKAIDLSSADLAATVWSVRINGAGANDIKDRCFEENSVRFNWGENGAEDYSKWFAQMKKGDFVVSYYGDESYIDAIGRVSDEAPFYDKSKTGFRWSRKVKWLVKNVRENIYEINGNTRISNFEISKLNRVKVSDLATVIMNNDGHIGEANVKPYVFIIDEINRGNISKIFGELITLIEPSKREGNTEAAEVRLPYTQDTFSVPENVYLLGTMNTADRSIAMMDTALRRRFSFIEMMPDSKVLDSLGVGKINAEGVGNIDVSKMLDTINKRIEYLYDREHTIGHAFFTPLIENPSVEMLGEVFKKKIIPLLQEYFYEDYQKIQLVLGDNRRDIDDKYKFIIDETEKVSNVFLGPTNIDIPEKKYTINEKAVYEVNSYIKIYSAQVNNSDEQ